MTRFSAPSTFVLTLATLLTPLLAACDVGPHVEAGRYQMSPSGGTTDCPDNRPTFDPSTSVWICPVGALEDIPLYVERLEDVPYLECPDLRVLAARTWDLERWGDEIRIDDADSGDVLDGWVADDVISADGTLAVYSAYDREEAEWSAELGVIDGGVLEGWLELEVPLVLDSDGCTIDFDVVAVREN